MRELGSYPLLASVPAGFTPFSGICCFSDLRSSDHDGRYPLTLTSVEKPVKLGGLSSITVWRQKRSSCPFCRADLSQTSGEKQYRASAERLDESGRVSIWDSNAENIRRSRRNDRPSSTDDRSDERNWDYASDSESGKDNWQWWRISNDEDTYEDDTDDDEDREFSWFDFDIKSALSMVGWMFPAAFIILPWVLGSPMLITMAFALFPLALKLLGPLRSEWWSTVLQIWRSSSSKSKQKRGKRSAVSSRDGATSRSAMENQSYLGPSRWGNSMSDDSRQEAGFNSSGKGRMRSSAGSRGNKGQSFKLGGWDEADEDTSVPRELTTYNRKTKLDRRRRKKEVPLFFRLLIALFPFLRSWGGFL